MVPAATLLELPATVDATMGALVEPGGNAIRAVDASGVAPGERLLVIGSGTIGLLSALFARARGVEVHLMGIDTSALSFALTLGVDGAWTALDLPALRFAGVIDATNNLSAPIRALELVEPGGRVVYIGLAGSASAIDTRALALKDVTAVGILGGPLGSPRRSPSTRAVVDPRPLVAATVSLEEIGAVLAGEPPERAGPGPKIHVDPRA